MLRYPSFASIQLFNHDRIISTNLLDKVEKQDEEIVENVQKGVKSRYYNSGRFSPKMEMGVHHFHRLISNFIST